MRRKDCCRLQTTTGGRCQRKREKILGRKGVAVKARNPWKVKSE